MIQIFEQGDPLAALGQATGQGLSTGLQMLVNDKIQKMQAQRLLERGFTPKEASLWQQFTQGGKTHLAKEIVERMQREKDLTNRNLPQSGLDLLKSETIETPNEKITIEESGLTPKERITREESRYRTNLPLFQKEQEKVKSLEQEGLSLQRLQELNESGKLPKSLQRWNVNLKSGELRIPFLANAETQAFVKTINDFTTKAKDSFGARVTNFELDRFMKRLPTLLNTEDGRRVILRQMEIINELNQLNAQATLDAFDSSGGVRKIDFDQAQRLAQKQLKPFVDKLKKEYVGLNSKSVKKAKKSEAELKKVEKGTEITEDIVDELLQKNNGDIEKAKKMARQLGYEF